MLAKVGEMASRKKQPELPEWAQRILQLRGRLNCSQGEFGRRIECSAMTVSRWEAGHQPPTAEHYIQLGRLAGDEECWFFWEKAGLRTADVVRTLPERVRRKLPVSRAPELETAKAGAGLQHHALNSPPLVAIPLLKALAGTPGCLGNKGMSLERMPATRVVGAPRDWCPNPSYTSLLRIKGHSMEPLIPEGAIVAVDSFQSDRTELDGKVVVVSSEEKGLCVSRFRHYEGIDILEPENHREYSAMVLKRGSGWHIVGRVLWWITEAP
jgi:SOS-response transcriptional repressor LexA/DNA-binding XRE family transcriptional regulator